MDPTESGLLKAISVNLNAVDPVRAYADYLNENGNPGWLIVANYPPRQWAVSANGHESRWSLNRERRWKLPWLDGVAVLPKANSNWRTRLKAILNLYAEGQVK